MVLLAASVCTRGGTAILSRQFRDMKKQRVEALLATFPRIADLKSQHTSVEYENVRFLYQPVNEFFVVLITNCQSNILEDVETLKLFAQVITSMCRSCEEREIIVNAFELISAFDEIAFNSYPEKLTTFQVQQFLEMDSHEEKIQDIIEKNKELEASEERKRRARQLELQRKELSRRQVLESPQSAQFLAMPSTKPPSFDVAVPNGSSAAYSSASRDFQQHKINVSALKNSSMPPPGRGLHLGNKKKTSAKIFEHVRTTDKLTENISDTESVEAIESNIDNVDIVIKINERSTEKCNRHGQVSLFDCLGDVTLLINDKDYTKISLKFDIPSKDVLNLKTHPNIDKEKFAENRVALKDPEKPFPTSQSLGLIRWKRSLPSEQFGVSSKSRIAQRAEAPIIFAVKAISLVLRNARMLLIHWLRLLLDFFGDTAYDKFIRNSPGCISQILIVSVNARPAFEDGKLELLIEYDASNIGHDLHMEKFEIHIPNTALRNTSIRNVDCGLHEITDEEVCWKIENVHETTAGKLTLTADAEEEGAVFPIRGTFILKEPISKLRLEYLQLNKTEKIIPAKAAKIHVNASCEIIVNQN